MIGLYVEPFSAAQHPDDGLGPAEEDPAVGCRTVSRPRLC